MPIDTTKLPLVVIATWPTSKDYLLREIRPPSLADIRQQKSFSFFFSSSPPSIRESGSFLSPSLRDGTYLCRVSQKYVASISTFLSPCPLARFPFSVISPGKHRGRCPESRTAGARRPPASGVSAPVFHFPHPFAIWSSQPPTARVASAENTRKAIVEFGRIPASRRLDGERRERR